MNSENRLLFPTSTFDYQWYDFFSRPMIAEVGCGLPNGPRTPLPPLSPVASRPTRVLIWFSLSSTCLPIYRKRWPHIQVYIYNIEKTCVYLFVDPNDFSNIKLKKDYETNSTISFPVYDSWMDWRSTSHARKKINLPSIPKCINKNFNIVSM